jgi:nucleotidyltransferase/DNA polymerase involved in DNA repair
MRVVCILLKDNKDLKFLAETCLKYSPQISLGERWLFIEIGACAKLYSETFLYLRLQAILKKFEIQAKIEVGADMPSVLCAALFNIRKKELFPIEAIPYFFNPFKYEKQFEKMVEVFRQLGIRDFKKLTDIPMGLLTSKFNKDLNLVLRQINDAKNIYWPRYVPEEVIVESYEFLETQAISNLEPLTFVLKGLLERVVLRLRGQGQLVAKFTIMLEQEKYSTVTDPIRVQHIELAFPHSSITGLLSLVRDRLEKELTTLPLESDVKKITVSVIEKVPGGYRQKDFFSQKEEDTEALQSLISRLKDKIGEDRVFYAQAQESYYPEKSWGKTLKPLSQISTAISTRPLRILKNPVKLGRVDNYLICDKKRWRALEFSAPERLSGEWWLKEEGRNYQRVKTDSGEELWIYSPDTGDEYYLHGIYD